MAVDKFLMDLKNARLKGTDETSYSMLVAISATSTLRGICAKLRADMPVEDVVRVLREYSKQMAKADKYGALIANVARRVLWIVRDEYNKCLKGDSSLLGASHDDSLNKGSGAHISPTLTHQQHHTNSTLEDSSHTSANISPFVRSVPMELHERVELKNPASCRLGPPPGADVQETSKTHTIKWSQLKASTLRSLSEYIEEFHNTQEALSKQAEQHIRDGEIIMTYGYSHTLDLFLRAAGEKRKFTVLCVHAAPSGRGTDMAKSLKRVRNIEVVLLTDSSVFAMMSAVGKVLISPHLVLANGGVLSEAGTQMIALAAKYYTVPVLVVSAVEKFCPYFPADKTCSAIVKLFDVGDQPWSNENDPHCVIPNEYAELHNVHVSHSVSDYIEPDLVTLFVTNEDSFVSTYVYRLIAESYNPADADI